MKILKSSLAFMTTLAMVAMIESCNQGASVEERNKASVLKTNDELFTKGNMNYADEAFTADYSGQGPEWVKAYVKERREAFPDLQTTIEPIIAEGDMVAWLRTQTGTHNSRYDGYQPTGKKLSWQTMVFSRYNADGKIAEEWGVGNMDEVLQNASGIDGVYEYLAPGKGQSINRNGRFVYLFGPADGKGPMSSQAGTYTFSGDTVTNTITYATDTRQIGTSFKWKVKSWSGDTVVYETMNMKGELTGGGSAIRVSK